MGVNVAVPVLFTIYLQIGFVVQELTNLELAMRCLRESPHPRVDHRIPLPVCTHLLLDGNVESMEKVWSCGE